MIAMNQTLAFTKSFRVVSKNPNSFVGKKNGRARATVFVASSCESELRAKKRGEVISLKTRKNLGRFSSTNAASETRADRKSVV